MMVLKRASFIKAVVAAWEAYRKNASFFLIVSAIVFGVYSLLLAIIVGDVYFFHHPRTISFPLGILLWMFQELFVYQLLQYSIRIYHGETPSWESFFTLPSSNFIYFFLARIRYIFFGILRLFLFIVPGIVYYCSNYFAGYSIAHSLTDSLKKDALMSSQATKHNRWRIFLLLVVNALVLAPSIIAPFILPFMLLVNLDIYNQLMEPYNEITTIL